MTPKEFIEYKLNELKPTNKTIPENELALFIYKTIMSKKFRKYSANQYLTDHIKEAIKINIHNNHPINFVLPHGAYKLWRLEESPEPDWAELFASIYYTNWLKPICEVYKPGVLFEYLVDDLILPIMNNTPVQEVETYLNEYQKIISFLKKYQPDNFQMVITKYQDSVTEFKEKLNINIEKISNTNPVFTDDQLKKTELNVKPKEDQLKDPKWREKVRIIHDAYMTIKRGVGYYFKPEKIATFCQNLPSGKFLGVGTTKTSIAKFWIGIGVLKKKDEKYIEYILSPSQVEKEKMIVESISIDGLGGKNFNKIKIIL